MLAHRIQPEIGLEGDTLYTATGAEYREVSRELAKAGLRCTLHAPFFDLAPGGLDEKILAASRAKLGKAFDLIEVFRPASVVCHLNYEENKHGYKEKAWFSTSLATWRELLAKAAAHQVPLMLENTYETGPDQHKKMLEALSSPLARFCLDAGHVSAFAKNSGQNIGPVERWVEKTTSTEIYATEIIKWFPRAKFIQLVRDPRDNWAALKAAWEGRYRKFNDSSLTLLQSLLERGKLGMELAILNQKIIGRKQYLIVRFEDLVSQPKKYLTEICKFLNIKYQADLLKPTVLGKWWPGNSFENLKFKGPSKAKVGQWPKRITKEEAHLVEYYFYDLMKHFNYRPKSTLKQRVAAAVKHYKWHNFAQVYSFADAKITKYTKKDS